MRRYTQKFRMAALAAILAVGFILTACSTTTLGVPQQLRLTGHILEWNPVDGATGYVVAVDANEYPSSEPRYDLSTVSGLVDGQTYAVKVKATGAASSSAFSDAVSYTSTAAIPVDASMEFSRNRYDAVPVYAEEPNLISPTAVRTVGGIQRTDDSEDETPTLGNPSVIDSFSDGDYNYYLIDAGYVRNTPISSGMTFFYNGRGSVNITFERNTVTEESVTQAVANTISNSFTSGFEFTLGGSVTTTVGVAGKVVNASVEKETNWSTKISTEVQRANSVESTYETAVTKAQSITETIEYGISDGEPSGYYRLSLFAVCDVYFMLRTSIDNTQVHAVNATACARPDTQVFALDYDVIGEFKKTSASSGFAYEQEYYKNLTPPDLAEWDLIKKSEIVTTKFTAYFDVNGQGVGQVEFDITGLATQFNGKNYIYGNAQGVISDAASDKSDVYELTLRGSNKKIISGGMLNWQSANGSGSSATYGTGSAAWLSSSETETKYTVMNLPSTGNTLKKGSKISISNICVAMNEVAFDDSVPELAETTFTASMSPNGSSSNTFSFDVFGIKVQYNGGYYVLGNAYGRCTSGNSNVGGVSSMHMKNMSKRMLFGGTMAWFWPATGNNMDQRNKTTNMAVYTNDWDMNGNSALYYTVSASSDKLFREFTNVSIVGLCINLNEAVDESDTDTPQMIEEAFPVNISVGGTFAGNVAFKMFGIKAKIGSKSYLYGTAFCKANPKGSNVKLNNPVILTNTGKTILTGGTLAYACSVYSGLTSASAVMGYDAVTSANDVNNRSSAYMAGTGSDYPWPLSGYTPAFNGSVENRFSITGLCIEF